MNKTIIYVDVHEKDSKIDQWLKVMDCHIDVRSMETGDIVLDYKGYTVGIEMKRKSDFDTSLHSGRLHDQITRLYDSYNYPVLIIEGWQGASYPVSKKAMKTMNLRLATYETADQVETLEVIKIFVRLLEEKKFSVLRRPIMLEKDVEPGVRVLCSLPFISQRMAKELLEKYETPLKALDYLDEWDQWLNGITSDRVIKIRDAWRGEDSKLEDVPFSKQKDEE